MSRQPGWIAAATVALAVGCVVAARVLPDPSASRFYPPCPLRAITGLYCPGCGSCRALYQLAHGHLAAAFRLNPLMVLSIPFVSAGLFARAAGLNRRQVSPRWTWALLVVVIAFGVLRNIPIYPLTLLAPRPLVIRGA